MSIREPTEADIQRTLFQYLEARGCVVVRVNSGAVKVGGRLVRFNRSPGCSDLLVCLPGGRMAALEVKRLKEHPTPAQLMFLDRVRRCGGIGAVVRSTADVDAVLAEAAGE